jgi:hypothetical protein
MTIGVGTQPTNATINNALTGIALQMRNVVQSAANLSKQVNSTGNALDYLVACGYGSAANADNPGGISDAQLALNLLTNMETIVALATGNATLTTATDFTGPLSLLWNAQ